jgi:transposase
VSAYRQADTKEAGGKRRRWSLEVKRQLVAETFEPGSSVPVVARRHDINTNQLFKWRRELVGPARAAAGLVSMAVIPEPAPEPVIEAKPAPGRIEIALAGGVRVRIEGAVDPAAVTAAVAAVIKGRRRPTPRSGRRRGSDR